MIRINLLPQELRRKDGTSLKVVGATLVGALLVFGSFGFFAFTWFGDLSQVEGQCLTLEERLKNRKRIAEYSDLLKAEKKQYEQREKTITDIRRRRVLWTHKLDQFVDVINNDGNADDRHLTWYDSLEFKPASRGKKKAILLSLGGHSAGPDMAKISNLIDDITEHEFWEGFFSISEPEGSQEKIEEKLDPKESVKFPLKMYLEPGAKGKKKAPRPKPKS